MHAYGDYLNSLKERIARNDSTLTEVNFWHTACDDYIESMRRNTHVKRMWVNDALIQSLDHLIGNTTLTELYLEECTIHDASVISHLTHLTHLSVSMTLMKDIEFIPSLVNLSYLDISFTKLKENVIPSIQHLSKLQVLNISEMRLGDVTAMRSLVTHLLHLTMDFCHITSDFLDSLFSNVDSPITNLSVECNDGVTDLKFVRHLRDLDFLQAGECQIIDLSPLNQVHVTQVHVHNNPLMSVDCLQYNTSIETLYMGSCVLSDVDSLLRMPYLTSLDILHNDLIPLDVHETVMRRVELNKINLPNRRLTLRQLTSISLNS